MTALPPPRAKLPVLTIGALGVVYGDIGTSPLYALQECFAPSHGIAVAESTVLGVLSLMVWTLLLIVCTKYLGFVLRADNRGEGGILAMLALAFADDKTKSRRRAALTALGVFGAALLYGDGMLTPCITVLGAIEGLKVVTPDFQGYTVPISIAILVGLFAWQGMGSGRLGNVLGPLMLLWFAVLAALGVRGISLRPEVLQSFDPRWGIAFLGDHGFLGFLVLGAVFLVATGSEALYADLGHFGKRPMRAAWFTVVFPALLLNYLGQGALLLAQPDAADNPFFNLAPQWGLVPLVVLATLASAIASQAVISGAFSLTVQAIQLGYLPRMRIRYTSSHERGQVYVPQVNWILMLSCVAVVLGFRTVSNLAAAYGIAVSATMVITSLLFFFVARRAWSWAWWKAAALAGAFLALEALFLGANGVKIPHGGWFPLAIAGIAFVVMSTWKKGRRLLGERLGAAMLPVDGFLESLAKKPPIRVQGTAIYMAGNANGTPLALLHNLKHNKVLHESVVLLTIVTQEEPHVPNERRVQLERLSMGFSRVIASYGFMESPRMTEVLAAAANLGLEVRPADVTFFLSRETIVPSKRPRMMRWRARLFGFLSRNSQPATAYFGLPVNRVVELGVQIDF